MNIDFYKVRESLEEFSSKELQEFLWNNKHGNDGIFQSDFVEAWEGLFGISRLGYAIEKGDTNGINPSALPLLKDLEKKLRAIEYERPVEQVIEDPLMQEVRILAAKLLVIGVELHKSL